MAETQVIVFKMGFIVMKSSPTAAFLCAPLIACTGSLANAQGTAPSTEVRRSADQIQTRDQPGGDGIAPNGRCGGMSFGTGARRTATGPHRCHDKLDA